eukprot:7485333-Lingulodinium_polyedra.AAC.1
MPLTQVAASCPRPGPRGGRQTGVAITCPSPRRISHQRDIVPGCAVEATITNGDGPGRAHYLSLY